MAENHFLGATKMAALEDEALKRGWAIGLSKGAIAAWLLLLADEGGGADKRAASSAKWRRIARDAGMGALADPYSAFEELKGKGLASDFVPDYPRGKVTAWLTEKGRL